MVASSSRYMRPSDSPTRVTAACEPKGVSRNFKQSSRRSDDRRGMRLRRIGCFRKANRSDLRPYPIANQPSPESPRTCFEGPFGEVIRATGPMAKVNPLRFSTKYQDDDTDLLYYGYRYYNPSTGRWISRDPAAEGAGANLLDFVANSPVSRIDAQGLFATGDHRELTTLSFNRAVGPPTVSMPCLDKVLDRLIKANDDQDHLYFGDLERHYNRKYAENESEYWRGQHRWAAATAFLDYVAGEEKNFRRDLRDGILGWPKHDCKGALKALGHLSHSWQDFYGHGIDGDGSWGSGFLVDSPDLVFDLFPSTYGSWQAEHPIIPFMEPPFSTEEYQLRMSRAADYVAGQFGSHLRDWGNVCNCECNSL